MPTGFAIALPAGFEAQVRPRSGLAVEHGVTVLNAPGTIDADYRGEVKVLLVNHGDAPFAITRGMRIAQLVVAPVIAAVFVEVDGACRERRAAPAASARPGFQSRVRLPQETDIRRDDDGERRNRRGRHGRGRIYDSITDTIGDTPLVRLDRIAAMKDVPAHLLAKLEFFNPIAQRQGPHRRRDDRRAGGRGQDQARA